MLCDRCLKPCHFHLNTSVLRGACELSMFATESVSIVFMNVGFIFDQEDSPYHSATSALPTI